MDIVNDNKDIIIDVMDLFNLACDIDIVNECGYSHWIYIISFNIEHR
jgi:hypothetical protein